MKPQISVITLGVKDIERAKRFYKDGLGWPAMQEYPEWVCLTIDDGRMGLGLRPLTALAADAGVNADGHGFGGVTLSYLVNSEARVAAVLEEAKAAGGAIVRPAETAPWGGALGYFADPDGYLWKVAAGAGEQPFAAE